MKTVRAFLIAAAMALPAAPAFAHPGHGEGGFGAGILHPLTGMDHLAAMLMVGLWAGLVGGRALWVLPAAFLTAMLAGFGHGVLSHGAGQGVEMVVMLSVLALGGAVALNLRAPLALAGAVAAVFGFAHGMAHGLEAPGGHGVFGFAGGFLVMTALLHVVGLGIARHVPAGWVRAIGVAVAGFGLVLAGAA
jgi:urease accessory protein